MGWLYTLIHLQPLQDVLMQHFKGSCSSTEAEAEIKDEHWHVDDQPQAPGDCKLMAA